MFKKIEIWILYLVIVLSLLFTVGFGALVRQELAGLKVGWFSKTALAIAEIPRELSDVVNFVRGNDLVLENRFPTQIGFEGVPNSQESYLLLSKRDSDLNEGIVELIDLRSFNVLHTWNPDFDHLNSLIEHVDEFKFLDRDNNNSRASLFHPKLTEDGGLIFTNGPLSKIDPCGNLILQISNNFYHHSVETDIDGNIWAPSFLYPTALPLEKVGKRPHFDGGYKDAAIVKLSPDGKILFEKSVSEIFVENELEYLLYLGGKFYTDPIHLNDIQPVDFDSKYWNKGDVFLSLRHQSMVFLYRPSTNKIIWKGTGKYFEQHDVDILDDHRISVFNNNSKRFINGNIVDGHNEVIIYDFETGEYSFYLKESLAQSDVRTITQGRSEILSNNDLFIEETLYGRTVYFNADGSVRWSHVNMGNDAKVYPVYWSRILFGDADLLAVNNLLAKKGTCGD